MNTKKAMTTAIITAFVCICAGVTAHASTQTTDESENQSLADKYPLEAVKQHALKAAQEMDVPDDRLYGIITYAGEDHLIVADEHKEEGHYGVEYIHTLIDTDGIDKYEPEPVNMYFTCPECGVHSSAIIRENDDSYGRVFWCNCEEPWIIGLSISNEEIH